MMRDDVTDDELKHLAARREEKVRVSANNMAIYHCRNLIMNVMESWMRDASADGEDVSRVKTNYSHLLRTLDTLKMEEPK